MIAVINWEIKAEGTSPNHTPDCGLREYRDRLRLGRRARRPATPQTVIHVIAG